MYDHNQIETKWQQKWEELELFQGSATGTDPEKEMLYLLFAFAYPSGSGLHVGHVESKTALDILARFNRMKGKNVFFPVGWDAFGLPAENYAIKTGVPPVETTKNAIDTFRRQIKRVGISYDWKAELATCHPGYYRWTQWIFLQLFEKGLAYQKEGAVNWCSSCQTVLANEQVVAGECERCGTEVVQKNMKQWYFKITEYKDELISGLEQVDWPEPTKQQQLNWIGKSEGAKVKFSVVGAEQTLTCFTTRIDTIFGVTFLVISPEKFTEMGMMEQVSSENQAAVTEYLEKAAKKTEEQRKIGEKDKTGVDTGIKVKNPINGEEVPLFVADYVLVGYGTGVVMGVPAHDERDNAFATKFGLPIVQVIKKQGSEESVHSEYGELINSGAFTGTSSEEAQKEIPAQHSDVVEIATTYKLRDWSIGRQRYWGVPIPIVYDPEGTPHPVKDEHLPWTLPTDVEFKPTGESPLKDSKEFIERTEKLYGKGWRPEVDTMDTFVDSSWYFLRYIDARNEDVFASSEQLEKWLPVDFYMIGPEHIVLHLLYSRFFTKFLRDQGYLKFDEPFMKMRHQGMILGPDGKKMSKSKGNVINPDDIIEKFGADTLRMYEMFMGPIEADKPWDASAVAGVYRFLQRVAALVKEQSGPDKQPSKALVQKLHQTIAKISRDIPDLKFNTSIAALMEFVNTWEAELKSGASLTTEQAVMVAKLIAPFAPFLAEELYQELQAAQGVSSDVAARTFVSIHTTDWPEWDESLAVSDTVTMAVQVNGKVRAQVEIEREKIADKEGVLETAKAHENVQAWVADKEIVKEIYVPGKIINIVVT